MNGWTLSKDGRTYTRGDFRITRSGGEWCLSHRTGAIEAEMFARPSDAMKHVVHMSRINAAEKDLGVRGTINQSRRLLAAIRKAGGSHE